MDFADIRKNWWDHVASPLEWKPTDRKAKTVDTPTPGCWVRAKGCMFPAYLKPDDTDAHRISNTAVQTIAAREKIASDLSYVLELHVPPVQLYLNPWARPGGIKEVMLSLDLYEKGYEKVDVYELNKHWQSDKSRIEKHLLAALPLCGAMGVFNTWLGQADHANPDQIFLLRPSDGNSSDVRIMSLDYANSMGWPAGWKYGGWKQVNKAPALLILEDNGARERCGLLDRIRQLSTDTIEMIVRRIPSPHLSDDEKAVILEGLLGRRSLIGDLFQ